MPWNPALPADSSKIRLSANLIRQNFAAVQAGTVPAVKWNLVRQASTPTQPSNSGNIYTFAFNSKSELYYQNDSNQLVRLTQNGSNGSSEHDTIVKDLSVRGNGIAFGAGSTYFYNANNFIVARASVNADGSASVSYNLNPSQTATGTYRLRVPAGIMTNSNYQVILTPWVTGDSDRTIIGNIYSAPNVILANPTDIGVYMLKRDGGTLRNAPFDVIIVGGR